MGANQSNTRQKLQNSIKNELGINFDVDQSTNCKMSNDQSQEMSNISISGSKNVELKQMADVQNLCYATSVANLDVFSQLAADTQDDIMQSLKQEGGIGLNMSDTSIDVLNQIQNKINIGLKVKATKDCLTKVNAPQSMKNITIQDAMNINLSQESSNFNKCILDTASAMAQENGVDLTAKTKVQQEVTQKGFDPLASLTSLVGGAALLGLMPIIISVSIVVISSSVLGGGALASKGSGTNEIPPPPGAVDATGNPIPGQVGAGLGRLLGIGSQKGRRLFALVIKVVLVIGISWLLYRLLFKGGQVNTIEKYQTVEGGGYQARPLALRHQYHYPHLFEDTQSRAYAEFKEVMPMPNSEIPSYVQRWY